jgi:hypothetical protein
MERPRTNCHHGCHCQFKSSKNTWSLSNSKSRIGRIRLLKTKLKKRQS